MRSIARFYSWFWVLYFPLCIAFYDLVNDYVDEFMTLILILFTCMKLHSRYVNRQPLKEAWACILIFLFYLVYSLILKVNVPMAAIIDFQQQIRPYAVFYCTLILMPQFSKRQKKWMLFSILASLVGYLFWKRSTIWGSENVIFGSLSIGAGMTYYLFTKETGFNRYVSTAIVLFGLLCGKFKYIGECVAFVGVVFLLKKKIKIGSQKSIAFALVLVCAVIFFAWDRFDSYYVSGMNNEELARPMMYKTAPKVLVDYFPFGSGLGTFGTAASAKTYYSPLYYKYDLSEIWGMAPDTHGAFNADAFYPCLAQLGFVGLFFFFVFWKRRLSAINNIQDLRYYKIAIMAFLCLAIENTADTSYLSGRGMVYFMLIALCLSQKEQQRRNMRIPNIKQGVSL